LAGQVKQRPINGGSYEKTHIGELGRPAGDFKITRKGDIPYEYRGVASHHHLLGIFVRIIKKR